MAAHKSGQNRLATPKEHETGATHLPQLPGARLVFIQYLRGIAALLVVVDHCTNATPGIFTPFQTIDFGRPGVLIFFVISGFVMQHSCINETPLNFAYRRIIRVVPLYWIMTLVFYAILFRSDLASGEPPKRLDNLIQSLLFIPHFHEGVPSKIWPILVPGWTLDYEMFFFLLFFIGIVLRHALLVVSLLIGVLLMIGLFSPFSDPRAITWTSPMLGLFMFGMGLAHLWKTIDFKPWIGLLPVGLGLVLVSALQILPQGLTVPAYFVSAVVTVAGTLAAQARWPQVRSGLFAAIGDASYSIYLSHTITLIFVNKLVLSLPLEGWSQTVVHLGLGISISVALGLCVYHFVEHPTLRALRRRVDA